MDKLGIPGAGWLAIITGATWWVSTYMPEHEYAPFIIAGLGAVLKLVEVMTTPTKQIITEPPAGAMGAPAVEVDEPGKLRRFLVG